MSNLILPPIDWGDLRRLTPISETWGFERGGPLDRYYIERFLERSSGDIKGRVLEVKDNGYTTRFGSEVSRSDVLDINPANARATILADLTVADELGSNIFDCFILTQTLHQIYDIRKALRNAHRTLRPGGVLLCTLPSVTRVDAHHEGGWREESDYWRFTGPCIERLFGEVFQPGSCAVRGYGNVLTCVAFLHGIAPHELKPAELDYVDPWFPLIFSVRAVKA